MVKKITLKNKNGDTLCPHTAIEQVQGLKEALDDKLGKTDKVSSATSADSATKASKLITTNWSGIDVNNRSNSEGVIEYHSMLPNTTANIPTASGYQNAVMSFGLLSNGATAQMFFSKDKPLYYRSSQTGEWQQIAYKSDVDNIEIGGRNLALNSDVSASNASYLLYSCRLSEALVQGETYTFTVWGTLGSDRENFNLFESVGGMHQGEVKLVSDGKYSLTFKYNRLSNSDDKILRLYQMPSTGTSTSTIQKVKVERGNKATDWSPTPEDVQAKIAFKYLGYNLDLNNFYDNENKSGTVYINVDGGENLTNAPDKYGCAVNFGAGVSNFQLFSPAFSNKLYHRNRWWSEHNGKWKEWKQLATTDDVQAEIDKTFLGSNTGELPTSYIDITDYNKGAADYQSPKSGIYTVKRSGFSDLFVNFNNKAGSTSALEFMARYRPAAGSGLYFRTHVDNNRVDGAWQKIAVMEDVQAVQEKIDGIEIGGTNLLRYIKDDGSSYWSGGSGVTCDVTIDGDVIKGQTNGNNNPRIYNSSTKEIVWESNTHYVLSYSARGEGNYPARIIIEGNNVNFCPFSDMGVYTSDWKKYVKKFTTPSDIIDANTQLLKFYCGHRNANDTTSWLEVKDIKIERGNKATDWSPAPEDVQANISNAETRSKAFAEDYTNAEIDKIENGQTVAQKANSLYDDDSGTYKNWGEIDTAITRKIGNQFEDYATKSYVQDELSKQVSVPIASETEYGKLKFATPEDVTAVENDLSAVNDTAKAVTPYTLKEYIASKSFVTSSELSSQLGNINTILNSIINQ